MLQLSAVIIPIYTIIAIGFLFTLYKRVDEGGLMRLLFYLIMPSQIFISIVTVSLRSNGLMTFMGIIFPASLMTYSIAACIFKYIFKNNAKELIINCMASAHINIAFAAIPVFQILQLDFEQVVYMIMYQTFITTCILYALEALTSLELKPKLSRLGILIKTFSNPIIIASILGTFIQYTGIKIYDEILTSATTIASAANFLALFLLGASFTKLLPLKNMFVVDGNTLVILLLKTVVYPTLCYFLGHKVFNLNNSELLPIVLIAAMPTANNCHVYSTVYKVKNNSNKIVFLSTFISITLTAFIMITRFAS